MFNQSTTGKYELEILSGLEAIIYVCDLQTREILFANEYARNRLDIREGDVCWSSIYGGTDICKQCVNSDLLDTDGVPVGTIKTERYNPKADGWFRCNSRAIKWVDGKLVRLEMAVEITESVKLRQTLLTQNEYYRTVLNSIGDGAIITDQQGLITWMNPKAIELTGWSQKNATGRPLKEVFQIAHSLTGEPCVDPVSKVLKTGSVVGLANHTSLFARDGKEYQIADTAAPVRDEHGEVHGVVLIFHDVSEEYEKAERLRKSEERLNRLFKYSMNAIALHELIYDEEGKPIDYRFITVNKAFEELTGWHSEQLIGKTVLEVFPAAEAIWIEKYGRVALSGTAETFEEYSQEMGKYYEVRAYSPQKNHFVSMFQDITERKLMEQRLNELVFIDELTGLHNRRYFEKQLENLNKAGSLPLSVLLGDVNGLKIINDSMGHGQGDAVLQRVADAFEKVRRPQDIVARWGGDEFVMLLPNTTLTEAEQICLSIEKVAATTVENGVAVSMGLGCATKTVKDESIHVILREAENRMFQHKMNNAESSRSALVFSLQRTLAEKSHETEEHARHLQNLALGVGKKLGLSDVELDKLSLVALLHDIGKVAIPESILDKPGPLTDEEWDIMKKHCEIGYRIVASSPDLIEVAEGVLAHHERWDGTGYPKGLKAEEIPLVSRIISVVDAYDAMTTDRSYRLRITSQEALQEIIAHKGKQFDPVLADQFVALMNKGG